MTDVSIRPATPADASAIASIYNHYIATSTATFDTESKSVEDRVRWLAEHGAGYPVLVVERGDDVIAWGSLSKWGTRCAYRHTVEISTYLAPEATGQGLGTRLAEALIAEARRHGHHAIVSQIVSENEASLKMSERLGFETAGTLRQVGRKFDRWLDLVMMELVLEDATENTGAEK